MGYGNHPWVNGRDEWSAVDFAQHILAVSRHANRASDRRVNTSQLEGKIRPRGLLAAMPQKEACDGESTQDGERAID
jgi:hypothetical protein